MGWGGKLLYEDILQLRGGVVVVGGGGDFYMKTFCSYGGMGVKFSLETFCS